MLRCPLIQAAAFVQNSELTRFVSKEKESKTLIKIVLIFP